MRARSELVARLRACGFGMPEAEVVLSPPNPAWVDGAAALIAALPPAVSWHHVGSTSVPGLAAKPVADVLGVVEGPLDAWPAPLAALGLQWVGEYGIPGRRFLRLREAGVDYAHLHLFTPENPGPSTMLWFRDELRRDPGMCRMYQSVKQAQWALHAADREAYTEGKAAFIAGVLAGRGAGPGH